MIKGKGGPLAKYNFSEKDFERLSCPNIFSGHSFGSKDGCPLKAYGNDEVQFKLFM
jgi:hypothetical protein